MASLSLKKTLFCEADYAEILERQHEIVRDLSLSSDSAVSFLYGSHKDCLSFGNRFKRAFSSDPQVNLLRDKFDVFLSDRGGEITWHGTGQLVVYPIFNLSLLGIGISEYVCLLLKSTSHFLKERYGIETKVNQSEDVGLYHQSQKIAFIGLRNKGDFVYHGISINIYNNLNLFSLFTPCGRPGRKVTNLEMLAGVKFDVNKLNKIGEDLCEYLYQRFLELFLSRKT